MSINDNIKYYILIILFILYIFRDEICMCAESFTNKNERAVDINRWFNNTSKKNINYATFKKRVDDSDIVEYSAAQKLHSKGNLTPDNLLKKI